MLEQTMMPNDSIHALPTCPLRWRFGGLSAAALLPLLQQHLMAQDKSAHWQLAWLNNDGRPVIGLLPKVSWTVYFNPAHDVTLPPTYKVIKTCRDINGSNSAVTTEYMSYAQWQDALINYSDTHDTGSENNGDFTSSSSKANQKPSYYHGLIGFIGYDMAAIELSPDAAIQQASQPCAMLGHYDIYLTPDTHINTQSWSLNVKTSVINDVNDNTKSRSTLTALIAYLNILDNTLSHTTLTANMSRPLAPLTLTAQWHKCDYQQAFEQTQRYLVQGDCYQINLTQAWQGHLDSLNDNEENTPTLIDYLPALHRNTQAPFAGYLGISHSDNADVNNTGFELLSCSPELFFTFIKDDKTAVHHICTKPIKGTKPRGNNAEQDFQLKQQLIDSDKDRAENVMIVDLLRNDLGKYAKTGSVKVPHLFTIESFSNVHHMVSTITAELTADTHPLAVLFGSLPAGSITGTPKKRAVEIIAELETAARGAYCGTMGYMNFDGSGQWNVLIRTLQANASANTTRQVSLWAGGGITIASDCDDEYQECLDKVGNLLNVLAQSNG